ncbi:MAG: hypothetical protein II574_01275, partial [Ruminococcus sp.]|nr:hypothetical protein [Ruminococcus sp.]
KILAEVDADFTNTKAKEEMGKLLREFSDIDVVISQNDDMTFGAVFAEPFSRKKRLAGQGQRPCR